MSRRTNVIYPGYPGVWSEDRKYRYVLWRTWPNELVTICRPGYVMFIGLNPSTATETVNDATLRRCIRYAKYWGYGALCMTNLFALRSTDPRVLYNGNICIGPENDRWLTECSNSAGIVIAAWGNHGALFSRAEEVKSLIRPAMYTLGLTAQHQPKHPLRLAASLKPKPWLGPRED